MSKRVAAADLILSNCRYFLPGSPQRAVSSIAIWKDQIVAIDLPDEIDALRGADTKVVNLQGRYLLPGLTDAHIHLASYARMIDRVDCDSASVESCLQRVSERSESTAPGDWIEGHGWDQNRWGEFGKIQDLDRASQGRPTYLTARSLHAAWANSSALKLAGIGPDTPDPPDGRIGRTSTGSPDGILYEGAMELVSTLIPSPTPAQLADAIDHAQTQLWSMGVTSVHDFDLRDCFIALQDLKRSGRLGLRVLKHILIDYLDHAVGVGLQSGLGDAWLRIGNIKVFSDGALGPRTAAMLKPYNGEPENSGILLKDEEELLEIGIQAGEAGFPVAIHAIGDAANHAALNALASLREVERNRGWPARLHRLEHLQVMHPGDLERPAALDVIASMQPIHAMSDRPTADRYWGSRTKNAYAWKSQEDAGARLVFGSDAPVESPNPFWGLSAAVSRFDFSHPERPAWHPEQTIKLESALRAYTSGPAHAAGWQHLLGSIDVGFLADFVILDRDLFQIPDIELAELSPAGVIIGGDWKVRLF